jgi:hypothetical protein
MILSAVLAITTYGFTRSSFVQQRETAEINQAFANAKRVQTDLLANPADVIGALEQFGSAQRLLYSNGVWTSNSKGFTQADIPTALKTRVVSLSCFRVPSLPLSVLVSDSLYQDARFAHSYKPLKQPAQLPKGDLIPD